MKTKNEIENTTEQIVKTKKPTMWVVKGGLQINECSTAETLEQQVERMINNKEPLETGQAPLIYTERKEGVKAEMNIRTDRFEIAIEATNKIQRSYSARREERLEAKKDDKVESSHGKDETTTKTA